jgi:thioredoxin-related protein
MLATYLIPALSLCRGSRQMSIRAGRLARGLWLASLLAAAPLGAAAARDAPFDDSAIVRADDPAWFKMSLLDLPDDLAEARAAGKLGLMVLFSTEGCAYCKAFIDRSLGDPAIGATVRAHFDTLHLEIFDDSVMTDLQGRRLPVKEFARREGAAFSPTLLFYGVDGKRMHRVVGYQPPARFSTVLDYVVGGHHRTLSYSDYLKRRTAGPPAAARPGERVRDALFEAPPHDLDRRRPASKPLLVLFEQRGCDACRDLHGQVLRDTEVRALLPRFQAVQLDAGDTTTRVVLPDGRRLTPQRWSSALGLAEPPAMVFFDESGREVLRIESVIYRHRMVRSLGYVLDKAYLRDIPFQRYTREKTLERLRGGK